MAPPSTTRAAAAEGSDALHCSVCFLALKAPPPFQCNAGKVICSSCGDKMPAAAGRSRVVAGGYGGYRQSQAHDAAGCACPAEGCGFAGSTTALVGHLSAAHGWPCVTGVLSGESCDVQLHDGINVFAVDREDDVDDDDDDDASMKKPATQSSRYLLVFTVARKTSNRSVCAFCIRPRAAAAAGGLQTSSFWAPPPPKPIRCQVSLTYSRYVPTRRGLVRCYFQRTNADVGCTDHNNRLPDPDDCFETTIHNSDDLDEDDGSVEVTITVTIHQ